MAYTVGDVVRLKSGGPDMTVAGLNINTTVQCTWFAVGQTEGRPVSYDFPAAALREASSAPNVIVISGDAADL